MNILLYVIIFIMGTLFGSFLTLATYRIPLKQNIVYKHSYCPKCNNKLTFLDLIPIFSYTFLRGKCRHCKAKIGPRYFIIEFLSGISFVILATILNINIYEITPEKIISFVFGALYIVFLFLISGIDIEHKKIDKKVLIYGIILSMTFMLYQFKVMPDFNVNRFILYLLMIAFILILNTSILKKKGKDEYELNVLILVIIMAFFTYEMATITAIILTMLIIAIKILINKIINKKKQYNINIENQPIAFYLCIANVMTVLFVYIVNLVGD